jgi:hypothetical protein
LLTPSLSDRTYRAQIRSRNERLDVLAKVLPEDLCSGKEQELFEQVVDGIVEIVEVGGP